MFGQLTGQLVDQPINCRIHIFRFRCSVQLATIHVKCCISHLSDFLNFQDNIDLIDMFKIVFQFGKFPVDELTQRRCDFNMLPGQVQLYRSSFSFLSNQLFTLVRWRDG